MHIAQLAPLWKTVPPQKYGGTETVVSYLTETLVDEGHEVTLFAAAGSKTRGKLVRVVGKPIYEIYKRFFWNAIPPYEFLEYDALFSKLNQFDIIHNHLGFPMLAFSNLISVPIVTTLHSSLPPDFPFLANRFADRPFVSISNSQKKLAPKLNYVATVYHGIPVARFPANFHADSDYFLFLGTLSPSKGVDLAIACAKQLKTKLIIAGEVRGEDENFLKKKVYPFVDGRQITFAGEVDFAKKCRLLKGAKAVLVPSRWQEAFGLVMVEALACGTPVVALGNGSVPEIIAHGKTGFIAKTPASFIKFASRVGILSRQMCRKEAEHRFDSSIMAQGYLNVYKKLINQKK